MGGGGKSSSSSATTSTSINTSTQLGVADEGVLSGGDTFIQRADAEALIAGQETLARAVEEAFGGVESGFDSVNVGFDTSRDIADRSIATSGAVAVESGRAIERTVSNLAEEQTRTTEAALDTAEGVATQALLSQRDTSSEAIRAVGSANEGALDIAGDSLQTQRDVSETAIQSVADTSERALNESFDFGEAVANRSLGFAENFGFEALDTLEDIQTEQFQTSTDFLRDIGSNQLDFLLRQGGEQADLAKRVLEESGRTVDSSLSFGREGFDAVSGANERSLNFAESALFNFGELIDDKAARDEANAANFLEEGLGFSERQLEQALNFGQDALSIGANQTLNFLDATERTQARNSEVTNLTREQNNQLATNFLESAKDLVQDANTDTGEKLGTTALIVIGVVFASFVIFGRN